MINTLVMMLICLVILGIIIVYSCLLMELISAYQFAERKKINVTNVYRLINSGKIKTVKVGKFSFINWPEYNHLQFPRSKS